MPKQNTNDQAELIELIKKKEYAKVWEIVKYIGYAQVSDINDRFIIFNMSVQLFDTEKNNNFIAYYKNGLELQRSDRFDTFLITNNPKHVKELKKNAISPEEQIKSKTVQAFSKWK